MRPPHVPVKARMELPIPKKRLASSSPCPPHAHARQRAAIAPFTDAEVRQDLCKKRKPISSQPLASGYPGHLGIRIRCESQVANSVNGTRYQNSQKYTIWKTASQDQPSSWHASNTENLDTALASKSQQYNIKRPLKNTSLNTYGIFQYHEAELLTFGGPHSRQIIRCPLFSTVPLIF